MAKFNASQFKNKMKQQVNKINQAINKYNREVKRAVNDYNNAVRQHNTKVRQNRARIQSALRKLSASSNAVHITQYSSSVSTVHQHYQRVAAVYDIDEPITPFQEYVYSGIEQENANSLETASVIIDNAQPINDTYSLSDTKIMDRLSKISKDLDNRWKGALSSMNPSNPDATRHFCTSAREIFTEIFEKKATDCDVFAVFPNCSKTNNGNASRKSKIHYFLHKKGMVDSDVDDFLDSDIQNILELFHVLSDGTHGKAGRYSTSQLQSIKTRVEEGLIFLCDIVA